MSNSTDKRSELMSEELEKIAIERKIAKKGCSDIHPEYDIYHPDGHEIELLLIDKDKLLTWHDKQKKLYADAMLERLEATKDYLRAADVEFIPLYAIESERQLNGVSLSNDNKETA